MLHGSLDWDAGDRSLPLLSADLAKVGYDYVALGHIHQHRQVQVGRGLAVYPGPLEGKGFDDPGVGHLTLVELAPGTAARVETVPLAVRPVRTVTVDAGSYPGQSELAAALAALGEAGSVLRFRLQGVPGYSLHAERLVEELRSPFFHLEIQDDTQAMASEALALLAQEPTMRGLFVSRLLARLEDAGGQRAGQVVERALRLGLAALAEGGGGR